MVGIIRFVQGNYSSLLVRYRSLRAEGHAPREAWQQIKQAFLAESTATNPEQAWKNASGRAFEQVSAEEFAKQLEELKIYQCKPGVILRNSLSNASLAKPCGCEANCRNLTLPNHEWILWLSSKVKGALFA